MARTPSQRAAVKAVRIAAKKLIEEIDHYDPGCTDFIAHFHLDRSRWSDVEKSYFRDQATGKKRPVWEIFPVYRSAHVITQ